MATAIRMENTAARAPLSALTRFTAATLAACVVLMTYMQVVLIGSFDPPLVLFFGVPALLFAVPVIAVRRRWAPLVGAFFWAAFLAANAPYLAHDLAHPEFRASFMFSVVLVTTGVVGLAAGLGAAIQNYRAPAAGKPRLPRWFTTGLMVVTALSLGAIGVAALPRAGTGVDAATLASLPALTSANTKFDQTALRAKAGEAVALRLENSDAHGHSFDVDELGVHVSMPPGEPALALFTPTAAGTYTFYCSVPGHREAGMVGTLVVEP